MLGIFLSIIVSFLKALSELAGKVFVTPKVGNTLDEYSLALGVRTIVIIPVFLLCLFQGFHFNVGGSLLILFLGSLLNAITTITALKALKYGELSIVGPLGSLTIPLILITGFFITHELPNTYGFLGVIIIFIGTYFLAVDPSKKDILYPVKHIFSDLGARYMLLTTIIWSLTAPIDKLGIESLGILHWILYLNVFTVFFLASYMFLSKKKIDISSLYGGKNLKKIGAVAMLLGVGTFLQLVAIKYTLVVYVIAIKRSSGIFSVLFGAWYFKEKNIAWKLFAVSLMIVGVLCIVLGGNI